MASKLKVLVPLYVYPAPGAWEPLHKAIRRYPAVHFTIVINPNSGPSAPGHEARPDPNYSREIPRLNAQSNARTIGYVPTTWARRQLDAVRRDIDTYAGWCAQSPCMAVKGIFFDETPNQYNDSAVKYLEAINSFVRQAFEPDEGFVVHNPGSVPDERYMRTADLIVLFEETFDTFRLRREAGILSNVPGDRSRHCCILHSVSPGLSPKELKEAVSQLQEVCETIFLTDLSVNYYASFSDRFTDFLDAIA